ncbi:MAG: hypothetical protein V7K97_01615 [Nostoc sp.]
MIRSLDMLHFNRMQFNPATKILTVQSGAKRDFPELFSPEIQ